MRLYRVCIYIYIKSLFISWHQSNNSFRLLRSDKWRLVWGLCLGSEAGEVATLAVLPVDDGTVLRDAVVPDDDGAFLPLDAGLEVGAVREMVIQELENGIRLFLLEPNDFTGDCCPLLANQRSMVVKERGQNLHCGLT